MYDISVQLKQKAANVKQSVVPFRQITHTFIHIHTITTSVFIENVPVGAMDIYSVECLPITHSQSREFTPQYYMKLDVTVHAYNPSTWM